MHQDMLDADVSLEERAGRWRTQFYRYLLLMIDNFNRIEMTKRAAALTYTTILSIFPLLAVITATASSFYTAERQEKITQLIESTLLPTVKRVELPMAPTESQLELYKQQKDLKDGVRDMFTKVSTKFRESAGGLGVFGFIGMLVATGLLYYSIEQTVNITWHAQRRSNWARTFTNFITVIVFAPIVIGLSVTASTFAVTLFAQENAGPVALTPEPTAEPGKKDVKPEPPPLTSEVKQVSNDEAAAVVQKEMAKTSTDQVAPAPDANPADEVVPAPVLPSDEIRADETVIVTDDKIVTIKDKDEPSRLMVKIRSITRRFGFVLSLLPLVINILMITTAYAFLPHAKVQFRFALAGGVLAAVLWEFARYLFFYYVYHSTVNRTLAASLGLPVVFLLWVYITWLILLLGNLFVYITQNFEALWAEKRTCSEMLVDSRLLVATMILLGRRFTGSGGGYSEMELRTRLGLRLDEYDQILGRLRQMGFVTQIEHGGYMIAHPPEQIAVKDLLSLGCNLTKLPISHRRGNATQAMAWLQDHSVNMAGDMSLGDLISLPQDNIGPAAPSAMAIPKS